MGEPSTWYSRPAAKTWRTTAPGSGLDYHRSLAGYAPTPLVELPSLAAELRVGRVLLKDESSRLGLPAFKILGASWAVCRALCQRLGQDPERMTLPRLAGLVRQESTQGKLPVLVTATDGNHGRALARMARLLGVEARIHVPAGLGVAALEGIRGEGARLVEEEAVYDDVVARAAASVEGSESDVLIQDTAWDGYTQVPQWIVDGYTTLFREIDDALQAQGVGPDLLACPVGVGSLAQALVEHYRSRPGQGPVLLGVEPESAACLTRSLQAGAPVTVDTSVPTLMAGLNCGSVSSLGWPLLSAGMDAAVGVAEGQCRRAVQDLEELDQDAGPCGAAALAGTRNALAVTARRRELGVTEDSVVVLVNTEGRAANPLV
ncbi:diaminopropionate ammonia-lyase [Arthrobacter rhombi]|uniref:diaminopropionate ammonia-lyase n=1 Tax=Arthrobacter rhombi TaxID=71253 RepID=UPI003FD15E46